MRGYLFSDVIIVQAFPHRLVKILPGGQGLVGFGSKGPAGKQGASEMPKRIGFLYEKMEDKSFIRRVILEAARRKRKRREVRR